MQEKRDAAVTAARAFWSFMVANIAPTEWFGQPVPRFPPAVIGRHMVFGFDFVFGSRFWWTFATLHKADILILQRHRD
jgi:hypothetical protein